MKREKRDQPVKVYMTETEKAEIAERAKALGVSASFYLMGCEEKYREVPMLPELPEGCEIESDGPSCIDVRWHDGRDYQINSQGLSTCEYDEYVVPLDAAQYLLAHWAVKEAT